MASSCWTLWARALYSANCSCPNLDPLNPLLEEDSYEKPTVSLGMRRWSAAALSFRIFRALANVTILTYDLCVYIYISYAIFLVRSLLKCVHAPGPSNVRCHLSPCWCCRRFHLGTKKIMHKPSRAGQWNHCHILLQSLARPLRGTWFEDKCNGLHYVSLCKLMVCTCLHPWKQKKVLGRYVFASAANAMIPAACNICNSPASRWSTDLEIGPASLKSHRFNQHQWKRLKQH